MTTTRQPRSSLDQNEALGNKYWPENITYITTCEYADESLEPRKCSRGPPCGCQPNSPSMSCTSCECVLFACQEECRANCSAGEYCGNKRITKQQWKQVEVRRCHNNDDDDDDDNKDTGKGLGLFVTEDVKAGDLVIEYVGMVHGVKYLKSREYLFPEKFACEGVAVTNDGVRDYYSHANHRYIMSLDASSGLFLDARYKGNQARFTNHSCVPNCKMDRWKVRGVTRIALFAIKDIKKGDECTFDYAWERALPQNLTKCLCGEPTCRGSLEIGALDPLEHIGDDESDDAFGSQEIHSHWVKPPSHAEYVPPIGSTIKLFFERNAEYFVAEILEHDDKVQGNVRVRFENNGEECWESIKNRERYLVQEKSAMRVEKRSSTPFKRQSLLSSTAHQPQPLPKLACETVFVNETIREALVENLIIQKCQNFFQLSVEINNVGENICIQLSGQQASNAAEYLKRNIISLQQQVVQEDKSPDQNLEFSFSKITKRAYRIAFVPKILIDKYKTLESYFKSQCRNCTIRIITETKAKVEVKENDGIYILFETMLVSDLQSAVTTVSQYIHVYWFNGEIYVSNEIRPLLQKFLVDPQGIISRDTSSDEDYDDTYLQYFQVANDCKLLFFLYPSNNVAIFIQASHPKFIGSIYHKLQIILGDMMTGTKYIVAPNLYGDDKLIQWLQGFGANVSFDHNSKVSIRVEADNGKQPSSSALVTEALKAQQLLSNRDFNRRKQWAYGIDSPILSTSTPSIGDSIISELADLCNSIKLDSGTAVHALIIFKRFMFVKGVQSKIRETLLACFYIANKSQKIHKWKKLEQVLQKAYAIWYNGNILDVDSEEAAAVAKRILLQEEIILRTLHGHVFYSNNLDTILFELQKLSSCSISDVDAIRRLVCSSSSLRSMWKYRVSEVIVCLWVLLLQCDLNPVLSKYNISIDRLVSCCQELIVMYRNDESNRSSRTLSKMESNFEGLFQMKKNHIFTTVDEDLTCTYSQLHVLADNNVCDTLIGLDDNQVTSDQLASFLGVEVTLSVGETGFKLTTYCSDSRCLFVTYQYIVRLLEARCDLSSLTPKFLKGTSNSKPPSQPCTSHCLNASSSMMDTNFQKQTNLKGTLTGKLCIRGANIGHTLGTKYGVSDLEPIYESRALVKSTSLESFSIQSIERIEGTFTLLPLPSEKVVQRELTRPVKFAMGTSAASLQELYLLHQLLPHPNFISPLNIYTNEINRQHLVLTEMSCSLQTILNRRKNHLSVSPLLIRCWTKDLVAAVARCHENFINVRTLNPDSILINHNGLLQLSNLNCCSILLPSERNGAKEAKSAKGLLGRGNDKLTDAYVAPEILLGVPGYTLQSDIWCLSAVLSYLFLSKPLFPPRNTPSNYIASVYKVVGSPMEGNWLEGKKLPFFKKYKGILKYKRGVEKALKSLVADISHDSELAIACLSRFLYLNPNQRASPSKVLESEEYVNFKIESFGEAFGKDWGDLKKQLENLEIFTEIKAQELEDDSEFMSPIAKLNGNDTRKHPKDPHLPVNTITTPLSLENKSTNDFLNDLAAGSEDSDDDNLYNEHDIVIPKRKRKKIKR